MKEDTMASRYMRNMDLIHQSKLNKISIIGAGGIGSALIRAAAIMGFREFDIWDDDILEEHNLSTTAYNESCLGKLKGVAALVLGQMSLGNVILSSAMSLLGLRIGRFFVGDWCFSE